MKRQKETVKEKNPWLAGVLSLIPGLGHLYTGMVAKGLCLLLIDLGMLAAFFVTSSILMMLLMCLIYFVVMIPAVLESFLDARGSDTEKFKNSKVYVVVLLLTTGFSALPLLWQSRAFSKSAKVSWTVAVPVLAVLFFAFLIFFGKDIESFLVELN